MNNFINKVVHEWSYNVDSGMPDVKNHLHMLALEETLKNNNLPKKFIRELLKNLRKETTDKYTGIHGNPPKGKRAVNPDPPPKYKYTYDGKGSAGKGEEGDDDDSKYELEALAGEIEEIEKIDRTKQTSIRDDLQPALIDMSEKIKALMDAGDKGNANILAQKLVKNLDLQQALYLQRYSDDDAKHPGKRWGEHQGKIYVGPKGLKLTGVTQRSVGQADIIKILADAGVTVPVKPKGISSTAMSIQHTTRKRTTGTVTSRTTDTGKLIKEIKVGKRTITFIADPADKDSYELNLLKLNNIEDGEISFVDIGDTSTQKGREEAIGVISGGIKDMFEEMETYLGGSTGSKSIADKCEAILDKIKDPTISKADHKKLMLEMLSLTKATVPKGEVNEFVKMSSYIAESLEAMRHLKLGRETLVPASGNFKTADVIPLIEGDPKPTIVTIDGVQSEVSVKQLAGTSVKLGGGAPSSLPAKHENTIYGKLDKPIVVKGKSAKNTKEVITQMLSYYPDLFGVKGDKKKNVVAVPQKVMTDKYYKESKADLWGAFFEYYPELEGKPMEDSEVFKGEMARIKSSVQTQLDRAQKSYPANMDKGEDRKLMEQRMEIYHMSQFIAGMISNHPEAGIEKQAFANSDYAKSTKGGATYFKEIKEADGINTLSYVGSAYDQGYSISKTGHLSPTNTYATHLKHDNPALKMIKKYT